MAVLLGWAVLGQALSVGQLAGTGIVIGAVLVVTLRPGAVVTGGQPVGEETLVKT